jgi:ATP-dependent RNA helicase DDX35
MAIHGSEAEGDILIFMPGAEQVEDCCRGLREALTNALAVASDSLPSGAVIEEYNMHIAPLYAALPRRMQVEALQPTRVLASGHTVRKCIVSTNIAETSLTIEGVVYVIDCGLVKLPVFCQSVGANALGLFPVSRASAIQRAGRAGRVRPGKCYRLYSEEAYERLPAITPPEILRCDVLPVLLSMLALRIRDIAHFDLLDAPTLEAKGLGLVQLHALGIVDDSARLTRPVGEAVALLQTDPRMSVALLAAASFGCAEHMLSIAALLQVPDIVPASAWKAQKRGKRDQDAAAASEAERRTRTQDEGDAMKPALTFEEALGPFMAKEGDLLTLLNIYRGYEESGRSAAWCTEHWLNPQALQKVAEVRKQLRRQLAHLIVLFRDRGDTEAGDSASAAARRKNLIGPVKDWSLDTSPDVQSDPVATFLRKSLFLGYQWSVACLDKASPVGGVAVYRTFRGNHKAYLHERSFLARFPHALPSWVMFAEGTFGPDGALEMQGCVEVHPAWPLELRHLRVAMAY